MNEEQRAKRIKRVLEDLKEGTVIVEGKKDVAAFSALGIKAYPISKIKEIKPVGKIYVMTDIDEEGKRKAEEVFDYFHPQGFKVDITTRILLGSLLNLKHYEELDKKVREWEKLILML